MTATARVLDSLTPLLIIAGLLLRISDLEDDVASARANCEREQDEHQAYRAAHKGSCPTCGGA